MTSLETPPSQGADPWSPTAIAWITFLLTPLPGLVMHTLNFRRLNLGSRIRIETLKNVVLGSVYMALVLAPDVYPTWILLVTISVAGYVRATQLSYYNAHVRAGGRSAPVRGPVLYSVAWLGLLFVILTSWNALTDQRRYDRFQTLFDAGDLDAAAEVMERQLEIAPGDATPHWNLALVRDELGDRDGAAQHLRLYLEQFPDDVDGISWLEELEVPATSDEPGVPDILSDSARSSLIS